jgi:hypothetical protein
MNASLRNIHHNDTKDTRHTGNLDKSPDGHGFLGSFDSSNHKQKIRLICEFYLRVLCVFVVNIFPPHRYPGSRVVVST